MATPFSFTMPGDDARLACGLGEPAMGSDAVASKLPPSPPSGLSASQEGRPAGRPTTSSTGSPRAGHLDGAVEPFEALMTRRQTLLDKANAPAPSEGVDVALDPPT